MMTSNPTSQEKLDYFALTKDRPTRGDLVSSVALANSVQIDGRRIAVDCGCGAGADIAYLRGQGYSVYAFDVEAEAIRQCGERFSEDDEVHLAQSTFAEFYYPQSTLIVADASLFFCPTDEFNNVWTLMAASLVMGGVFCGSFLGPEDTMAGPGFERDVFWPEVNVVTEETLKPKFEGFEIVSWVEHRQLGETAQGVPHDWHIFAVVAQKTAVI